MFVFISSRRECASRMQAAFPIWTAATIFRYRRAFAPANRWPVADPSGDPSIGLGRIIILLETFISSASRLELSVEVVFGQYGGAPISHSSHLYDNSVSLICIYYIPLPLEEWETRVSWWL